MSSYALEENMLNENNPGSKWVIDLYNTGATLNKYGAMARAVPEIAADIATQVGPELVGEALVPWQLRAMADAKARGEDYTFDPSAFAADVLEMVPYIGSGMVAADIADSDLRQGMSAEQAKKDAILFGGASGIAEAIPFFGNKIGKLGAKFAPKIGGIIEKGMAKAVHPMAIVTGAGVPIAASLSLVESEERKKPEVKKPSNVMSGGEFRQRDDGFYYDPESVANILGK